VTPKNGEREGVGGGGGCHPPAAAAAAAALALWLPLLRSPQPHPPRRPALPQPLRSPLPPAPAPPPHPRPDAAPRVIFIRNIPKSVPLAQAEPRAALALISRPRLLPSGRAGGGGVGEGWEGGWGGWEGGGPSRPSPPWASRAGAARRPRSARRRPGLGVSRPPAVSADAEGRCPSRAEGTRPGRGAGPGAGARACLRSRRSSEVKVSRATTGRSQR
jgi:hypothetical protein